MVGKMYLWISVDEAERLIASTEELNIPDRFAVEFCHCGELAVHSEFSPNMDGYCQNCTDARCDAYPGECPNEGRRRVD